MVCGCQAWIYTGDERGDGVSQESVRYLTKQLKKNILGITVAEMPASVFIQKLFEACSSGSGQIQKTVIVFPGGVASKWDEQLGASVKKIREFVELGGRALMVCAGAYFSANHSEYKVDETTTIVRERGINFFPGQAIGPVCTKTHPISGMQLGSVVKILNIGNNEILNAYNIGGGIFVPDNVAPDACEHDIDVLGLYSDGSIAAASRKIGNGIAVMSFVHFEFDKLEMSRYGCSDPFLHKYFYSLNDSLVETYEQREKFSASLINKLDLN